jgi:MFS family permease
VRSTLRSPRLRRILIAYTVNRLGTWFGVIALMVAVYDHTHSAVAVSVTLFAAQALPAFVVPAVVARVEASRRRSELSGLYLFEAVATAAIAVLLSHFSLPAIVLLAALDGTAALAANALLRAELARAARGEVETPGLDASRREEQAQKAERAANAALNVGFSATFVLGPVIAGAVVASAGAAAALYIDVASFVICGAFLLDLHPHVEEAEGDSVRARLRAGMQHINDAPLLRAMFIAYGIALIFLYSAAPIEVTYAKATLHSGDRGFGLLLTAWGAGAVLGSLVFARSLKRSLGVMLGVGVAAIGAAYLGFWAAPSLAVACVAAFVGGLGNSLEVPSLVSLVQRLTPQRLQGRMMGAVESLNAFGLAIGLPIGGLLTVLGTPRLAFLLVGLGSVATALVLIRIGSADAPPPVDAVDPVLASRDPAEEASTQSVS